MDNLVKTNGHAAISFPPDHEVGMAVPEGGSNCEKCEYVDGQKCRNKNFVKWNGTNFIPGDIKRYCCDFFEAAKGKVSRLAEAMKKRSKNNG